MRLYLDIDPKDQGGLQCHMMFILPWIHMDYPDYSDQIVTYSNVK